MLTVFVLKKFDSLYNLTVFVLAVGCTVHSYSLRAKQLDALYILTVFVLKKFDSLYNLTVFVLKKFDSLYNLTVFVLSSWMHCTFLQSSY
jgi:hypothetical protein